MGLMRRAVAREVSERAELEMRQAMEQNSQRGPAGGAQARSGDRFASTLVIAASIIAAVRLARDPDISRPSPRLNATIADSVTLARRILDTIVRASS